MTELNPPGLDQVDRMMQLAVQEGVFPGGVLRIAVGQRAVFEGSYGLADLSARRPVTPDTVFDLASLTKPLATTLAVMALVEEGRLDLDAEIGSVLPAFAATDKSRVTIRQLLDHTSGLTEYRPYYIELSELPEGDRWEALTDRLAREPLVGAPGRKTRYSDLGFMVLSRVVQAVAGDPLDRYVHRRVYQPLGLDDLFFIDLAGPRPQRPFAATEQCPWRKRLLCGEVHDDNAWVVGGMDGHAGLFGTARDVHRLLAELLPDRSWTTQGGGLFSGPIIRRFMERPKGGGRPLGFDAPDAEGSSSGRHFSFRSVGHLGFTGTSFWMDLDLRIIVILLTNRVHPSRENVRIRTFRSKLHNAIMESRLV